MAMERLVHILRKTGDPKDEAIAEGIDAFRRLRGRDISMGAYLGLEEIDQPLTVRSNRRERSRLPLFEQTAESIRNRVMEGEFATGSKLPSETTLMQQYFVSRGTLRAALDMLSDEALIERIQGKGTFVLYRKEKT